METLISGHDSSACGVCGVLNAVLGKVLYSLLRRTFLKMASEYPHYPQGVFMNEKWNGYFFLDLTDCEGEGQEKWWYGRKRGALSGWHGYCIKN